MSLSCFQIDMMHDDPIHPLKKKQLPTNRWAYGFSAGGLAHINGSPYIYRTNRVLSIFIPYVYRG